MDTALILRLATKRCETPDKKNVEDLLHQSRLVQRLTAEFVDEPLFAVFRLMGISEIPFAANLPYTQKLIAYINNTFATNQGFAPLGGIPEIVPCYNSMVLEGYCRLGLARCDEAQAALRWIKEYQLFDRNQKTAWPHKGICKHGGCLRSVPCYIGIGKTVRALITYAQSTQHEDAKVDELIESGCNYMLRHNMYLRLTGNAPISAHITDIMMPQSYALSLTDLVYIVGKAHLKEDPRCTEVLDLIRQKQVLENQWKIEYSYSYKGYVGFETRRKPSEWISNLFPLWLS